MFLLPGKIKFWIGTLLSAVFACACAHVPPVSPPAPAKAAPVAVSSASATVPPLTAGYVICEDTAPVLSETTEDDVRDIEDAEDSDADIYISTAVTEPPPPVNLGGNGKITLVRYDTGEKISARYRRPDGSYDETELARINHAMRCSLTGREVPIAVKLVELLDAVEDRFGKKGLLLLSGYRTPELNSTLPHAARNSLHMLGWAADIKIQGYSSKSVKNYALKRGIGGVGYYPSMGFTHLDVGRVRYWEVRKPRKRRRYRPKKMTLCKKNVSSSKTVSAKSRNAVKRAPAKKKKKR
ncbi:MAG: DUF882 domain-containing protein [Elusimicrobiaceae bacterium]